MKITYKTHKTHKKIQKESYRSTMPFNNEKTPDGITSLSPTTERSVMPFNNVHTIQDVLDGRKYKMPGGGGDWSPGKDVSKNYKDTGDDYKKVERDLDIMNVMTNGLGKEPERWRIKVPGGAMDFDSFDLASQYLRKHKVSFKYLSRIAQVVDPVVPVGETPKVGVIAEAMTKCFMVESINAVEGVKETGSSFCVAPNRLMTCAHTIKSYERGSEIDETTFADGIIINVIDNGQRKKARVINVNLAWDVALLEVEVDCDPFAINGSELMVGEGIFCVGSPHGFDNNVSVGILGSLDKEILTHENAPKYMFLDISVYPGNSGGPVVRNNGDVIGMVSLVVSPDESEYGLDAGLPASYLEQFLKENS